MKKYLYIALGIIIGTSSFVYAATTITPTFTGGTGTSTPSGILYGDNGATNHVNTVTIGSNLTFSGGTLSATGGGGTGSGTVSTSTVPTIGNLAYWTSAGYPSLLGTVATGTVSVSGGITATAGQSIIGSGLTIGCTTATGSVPGCLSATDWTTFNAKQATVSVTTPITLTGASVGIVNQGTTAQVLHGNASGNASFGAIVNADITNATIDLTTKVTGVLPIANGGTNVGSQTTNGLNYFDGTKITSGSTFVFTGTAAAIGTTTPNIALGQLQVSTTSQAGFKPQLVLSDQSAASGAKHINLVSQGGHFTIGSSTDTFATSTTQGLDLNLNAGTYPMIQVGTTTAVGVLNLGDNPTAASASTTIRTDKLQFETLNAAGVYQCAYFVGSALIVQSGTCNN